MIIDFTFTIMNFEIGKKEGYTGYLHDRKFRNR